MHRSGTLIFSNQALVHKVWVLVNSKFFLCSFTKFSQSQAANSTFKVLELNFSLMSTLLLPVSDGFFQCLHLTSSLVKTWCDNMTESVTNDQALTTDITHLSDQLRWHNGDHKTENTNIYIYISLRQFWNFELACHKFYEKKTFIWRLDLIWVNAECQQ